MTNAGATLFAGGQVFDGETLLPGHAILVRDGRIERLAPAAEFDGFAGGRVDTGGGTVLPGLMDCHVHLMLHGEADPMDGLSRLAPAAATLRALEHAIETLRGGVTAIRDCGGRDYHEFAVRDACNAGRFPGPTIRAAGRVICMTGGHGHQWARVADGCDEVIKAVREQIHAGSDLVKMMASGGVLTPGVDPGDAHFGPEEMKAGIGEAKRFHRRTASHAQAAGGILNAVRAGVDSIEHGIFMDEQCLSEMLAAGTFLVPTLSALQAILAHADEGIPAHAVDKAQRVADRHRRSVRMYHEAGGRIAMGTDAGTPFNRHGSNLAELRYMVEIGMTPRDALVAASAHAADLIGLADRGRIRAGFVADLLIVDGDPLQDIDRVVDRAHHRAVIKDGVPVT